MTVLLDELNASAGQCTSKHQFRHPFREWQHGRHGHCRRTAHEDIHSQRNAPFEVAKRDIRLAAVQIDVDEQSGSCERMEPILIEAALS